MVVFECGLYQPGSPFQHLIEFQYSRNLPTNLIDERQPGSPICRGSAFMPAGRQQFRYDLKPLP